MTPARKAQSGARRPREHRHVGRTTSGLPVVHLEPDVASREDPPFGTGAPPSHPRTFDDRGRPLRCLILDEVWGRFFAWRLDGTDLTLDQGSEVGGSLRAHRRAPPGFSGRGSPPRRAPIGMLDPRLG